MRRFTVAGLVLLGLVTSVHASVVIDDFTAGAMSRTTSNLGVSSQAGLPTASVIGGARQMGLTGWGPYSPASPVPSISFTVDTSGGGSFIVDGVPDATPINSGLTYNGSTTGTSAMNVDLAPSGETGLALDFAYANFGPNGGKFDIRIQSPAGTVSRFVPVNNSPLPFRVFIPYHSTPNTLDEHHVTSISFWTSNGYWSNDFALTGISSEVPEPGSMALVGALIPLALRRRRTAR